jgi:hypothetical protein
MQHTRKGTRPLPLPVPLVRYRACAGRERFGPTVQFMNFMNLVPFVLSCLRPTSSTMHFTCGRPVGRIDRVQAETA